MSTPRKEVEVRFAIIPDEELPRGDHNIFMVSCKPLLKRDVERVLALGGSGSDVSAAEALTRVLGCAVGVDLTRRDLQAEAKAIGRPWDMAKGFDHSAPIGALALGTPPDGAAIGLTVNGAPRQRGQLSDMIWSPAEIVSTLSTYVTLAPGDLIFTGTPAGVGRLHPGDRVRAWVEGLPELTFGVA